MQPQNSDRLKIDPQGKKILLHRPQGSIRYTFEDRVGAHEV